MTPVTEGEITSMVRRFFLQNGFSFLSTHSSGDKLYYTCNGDNTKNKQPDTLVTKDDLVIICEDKIRFSASFSTDLLKLQNFLTSEKDVNIFKQKLTKTINISDIKIIGCLSSLAPGRVNKTILYSENFISLTINRISKTSFSILLNCSESYKIYFPFNSLELEL